MTDGETTIVHIETTNYYGLNATGAFVWNFLSQQEASLDEIIEAVSIEYETEPAAVRADIEVLLQALKQEQLIVER